MSTAAATPGMLGVLANFGRLQLQQKLALMIAIAAAIGLLAGTWMWSQKEEFRVLYGSVSDRDGGAILRTTLAAECGLLLDHVLAVHPDTGVVTVQITARNPTGRTLMLEHLAAFSLGGLTPFAADDAPGRWRVHRFRSGWSAEGRHEERGLEELNLERSWTGHGVRSERFGQTGSLPVNAPAELPTRPRFSQNLQLRRLCNDSGVQVTATLSGGAPGVTYSQMLTPGDCIDTSMPGVPAEIAASRVVDVRPLFFDPSVRCSATGPNSPPATLRTRAIMSCP